MEQTLKGWLKTTALPLNTDLAAKYRKLVIANTVDLELGKAYQYVKGLSAMEPAGITTGIRELAEIKKLSAENADGIMFSGTITQLIVEERALPTIDFGRIAHIIETCATDAQLKSSLGNIIVNIEDGEQSRFMRANKDAEVDALCLFMYWHSGEPQIQTRLIAIASDLVFKGCRLGTGSKVFAKKFELMNAEEKSREAMAVSSWRKCVFLVAYSDRLDSEGRFSDVKIPAERLIKAMQEDCNKIDEWNQDTLGRYLQVGRRLSEPAVRQWLIIGEATFKRNAFLDGITMLRACTSVTAADDELARMLQIIYLEQKSGLRKALKVDRKQPASTLFKAYLLRMRIFTHLEHILPKLADERSVILCEGVQSGREWQPSF